MGKIRTLSSCKAQLPQESPTPNPEIKTLFAPESFPLSSETMVIGIETEADTIVNMFKTDHGDFSDLLRKAFEHEKA